MSDKTPAAPTPLADILQDALRRLLSQGQRRLTRAADDGRVMLRLRQLQRDRDALWMRLGKTAYHLIDEREIAHPSLDRVRASIDELDEEIRRLQASLAEPSLAAPGDPGDDVTS